MQRKTRAINGKRAADKVEALGKRVNFVVGASVLLWGCGGVAGPSPGSGPLVMGAEVAGAAPASEALTAVWRRQVGRALVFAPTVAGSAIVVATGVGEVHALDAATGSRHWRRRIGEGEVGGVAVAGDRIYVAEAMPHGRVVALSIQDGRKLWDRRVGEVRHAPTITGDAVLVATADGTVIQLDAATGGVVWEAGVTGVASVPPLLHGESVVIATTADTLYRLNRVDGAIVGRTGLPGRVSAAPLLVGELLLLPMYSGAVIGHHLEHDAQRWIVSLDAPILAAPLPHGEESAYVLTRAGTVWRVGVETGSAERIAEAGGAATRSFARAGSSFLIGTLDGSLLLLDGDGGVAWRERFGDSIVAPAVAYGGAVYVPLLRGGVVKLVTRPEAGEERARW